jgi:hypothetical protein
MSSDRRSKLAGRRRRIAFAVLASSSAAPVVAWAGDKTYVGPSGLWSVPDNWAFSDIPQWGDAALLIQSGSGGGFTNVTFDDSAFPVTLDSLVTDYVGGVMTFTQSTNALTINLEQVGYNGLGVANLIGGTHAITGTGTNGLYVGVNAGSSGTVNLMGATVTLEDSAFVGVSGNGVINHTSGSVSLNGYLTLGGESSGTAVAGSGTYNLSAGTLSTGTLYVGLSGNGQYNQSGGIAQLGEMSLGYLPGSAGTATLSGGYLSVSSAVTVGEKANSSFTQTGGTHNNGGMVLGNIAGVRGTYALFDGQLAVQSSEVIGLGGVGVMTQSGGQHSADGLWIAVLPGSSGSMSLSAGSLVVNSLVFIGYNAPGTMTQTGGSVTNTYMELGHYGGGIGTYQLIDGSMFMRSLSVGYYSPQNNVFSQTGGSMRALDYLTVGDQSGAHGTYNLNAGTLNVGQLYTSWLGYGLFNQSGGASTFDGATVGHEPGSSGTVSLSGGVMSVNNDVAVGYSGKGTFTQTGGTLAAYGTVSIASQSGSQGTYNFKGGTFFANAVINNGTFALSGGTATVATTFSGVGTTTLTGINAAPTTVTVGQFTASSVSVGSNSQLTITPSNPRVTNTTNLTITGSGKVDLNNNDLLTPTAPATIRGYLKNAYTVNGDWSGNGLTSSFAAANPAKYALGYAHAGDASNPLDLPAGQTLVRPVLAGDVNLDGVVDFFDIAQVLGYRYNAGGTTANYTDGDLDYNGKVDFFDLTVILSGNYNTGETFGAATAGAAPAARTAATGTGTLSGAGRTRAAAPAGIAVAAVTSIGTAGDGKPDFEYNPATGDLRFRSDGGTFSTTGGAASFVSSLTISSTGGILMAGGASATFAGGTGATLTSTLLSSALTNAPGFTDGFDIGIVLAPGLDPTTLSADLTVKYQALNGGSLKASDITLTVPEPATLGLIALGAARLTWRRRRRSVRI